MAEDLYAAATVAGALSVEAALASRVPFLAPLHAVRGHAGQIAAAAAYRHLLGESSEIGHSHEHCEKVQDPYSLRCQPQVMGACLTQIRNAAETLLTEADAVSDNPLVFADENAIYSGGNFHAEPVAFAADNLALAIAEIGALAERRIALLIDAHLSKLPPFLVENGGRELGLYDRAGDRRRVGQREQVAGPSRFGRQPADLGQSGGPRLDGHVCRPAARRDGRQHGRHRGRGVAGGVPRVWISAHR